MKEQDEKLGDSKGYDTMDEYAGLPVHANKTATSYNQPGLPTPPAGWGRDAGINVSLAPDTCPIP